MPEPKMVEVNKKNTGANDPEVLMGDWADTSAVDIPLTRVDTPPQAQSSSTCGLAGPRSTQTSLATSNVPPLMPPPSTKGGHFPIRTSIMRPSGQQPVFTVPFRRSVTSLERGLARSAVARPVARHAPPVIRAPV
jgi:hypothetical protein